jgi:hypothetical protein
MSKHIYYKIKHKDTGYYIGFSGMLFDTPESQGFEGTWDWSGVQEVMNDLHSKEDYVIIKITEEEI